MSRPADSPHKEALHLFGYRYDIEDHAWLADNGVPFGGRILGAVGVARPISYRGILPIYFQGSMNSCPGHADQGAQQVMEFRETGEVVEPSRMLAYLLAQEFSGTRGRDVGANLAGALAGAQVGNCLEADFPYPPKYSPWIPDGAITKAKEHPARSHAILRSYDAALAWVRAFGPIIAGIEWWDSYATNRSGVLTADDFGVGRGRPPGHAVVITSESDSVGPDGRPDLELKNSHGIGWADRGWARTQALLIDRMLRSPFTTLIGVARMDPFACRQRIDDYMRGGVYG